MPQFDVYAAEITRFGPVGVVIITAYTNDGGYPRAESFLLIPDQTTLIGKKISFDVTSFQNSPVELNEEFMLAEALQQAKIDLGSYLQQQHDEGGNQPPPGSPNLIKDNNHLLVHVWVRGTCPHLSEVYRRTEFQDLKDMIQPIVNLPVISREEI